MDLLYLFILITKLNQSSAYLTSTQLTELNVSELDVFLKKQKFVQEMLLGLHYQANYIHLQMESEKNKKTRIIFANTADFASINH